MSRVKNKIIHSTRQSFDIKDSYRLPAEGYDGKVVMIHIVEALDLPDVSDRKSGKLNPYCRFYMLSSKPDDTRDDKVPLFFLTFCVVNSLNKHKKKIYIYIYHIYTRCRRSVRQRWYTKIRIRCGIRHILWSNHTNTHARARTACTMSKPHTRANTWNTHIHTHTHARTHTHTLTHPHTHKTSPLTPTHQVQGGGDGLPRV